MYVLKYQVNAVYFVMLLPSPNQTVNVKRFSGAHFGEMFRRPNLMRSIFGFLAPSIGREWKALLKVCIPAGGCPEV